MPRAKSKSKPVTSIETDLSIILGPEHNVGANLSPTLLQTSTSYNPMHGPKSPSKLDPKVFVPYGKISGTNSKTPRAIEVERKKVGLHKARKRKQFSKR